MTQRINFDTPVETYLSYREMKAVEREREMRQEQDTVMEIKGTVQ